MLIPSLLLMLQVGAGFFIPVQSSLPQSCFVFGEVFWSEVQITAMLSSNCPIHIERNERIVTMKAHSRTARFIIPDAPGVHEFVYRWGSEVARVDDEKIPVMFGGGVEDLTRRSSRSTSD
jgi:hypothetical protein